VMRWQVLSQPYIIAECHDTSEEEEEEEEKKKLITMKYLI